MVLKYCMLLHIIHTKTLGTVSLHPTLDKKKKLHGLSPLANYTDRATAACRRSDCQLLRIEGATWSAWRIPTAVFSVYRHEPLLFYKVALQLYSRGWVNPVPDPLLFFLVVLGIEPGPPYLQPRTLTTRPQRRSPTLDNLNIILSSGTLVLQSYVCFDLEKLRFIFCLEVPWTRMYIPGHPQISSIHFYLWTVVLKVLTFHSLFYKPEGRGFDSGKVIEFLKFI
jgi:hypothetical protein